jgi:ABC-type multidrug transport system fused ATPase/permease subunit
MPDPERDARAKRLGVLSFIKSDAVMAVLRPIWPVAPAIAALNLAQAALEGLAIGLIVPLFNLLLTAGERVGEGGLFSDLAQALPAERRTLYLVLAITALVAAKNAAAVAGHLLTGWLDARVGDGLRRALARFVLTIDYPFFLTRRAEELVNVIAGESWRATDAIRCRILAVGATAAVAGYFIVLVLIDWRLASFVVLAGFGIRRVESALSTRTSRLSGEVTRANEDLAGRTLALITGMRIIRVFGAAPFEQARFDAASARVSRSILRVWASGGVVSPLIEILFMLVFAAILLGVTETGLGLGLPELAAFLIVLQRAQPHLRALEQARVGFASASGGLRRVEGLLDQCTGSPEGGAKGRAFDGLRTAIRFDSVAFEYPGGAGPALHGASFDIEAGRTTALVGPSGSGKSTVVNLLCRLTAPTAGRILVDGGDLSEIALDGWLARIALAGQDAGLIDGTVLENVAYGAEDADRDAVWAALRAADAEAFVRRLPDGLDARVGRDGVALSGGQRQRIGLARAFLRDPDILILDEATNAIDGLSEKAILSLIREWGRDRTILVISHRESSLALCDREIRLEDGRVVARG